MAPFPRWADLLPELLGRIGDRVVDLKGYVAARGACTAWRRALVPPSPTLLVFAADATPGCWCPYAASLPTRRSFALAAIVSGTRCVGASNDGWLALSVVHSRCHTVFVLLNPIAAAEIILPPLIYESRWVSKVVFTPSPAKDDFAAAAICDGDRVAYVTAGATRWAVVMDPVRRLTSGDDDHLVDLVYTDEGHKVYCLTESGDVHVLRLPERRRRQPAAANDFFGELAPEFSLLQPPESAQHTIDDLRPLRWQQHQTIPTFHCRMMCCQQPRTRDQDHQTIPTFYDDEGTCIPSVRSQGPDLNAPATVEPLLSETNLLPFNPATVFPPPYHIISSFASAKNLVLCDGKLYQVWRNKSCTVTLNLPGGGRRRVAENEVLVLRYNPRPWRPWQTCCWDVVKDLGGHSVFVGRNNAVSVYAKGVPGLRGNCVYWIGGRGKDQGMVFDMESGRSTPVGFSPGHPHSTICWYFFGRCN